MLAIEKITIDQEHAGKRLDKFLVERFPEISRSQIQKAVKDGTVLINGRSILPHHFLKNQDLLEIKEAEEKKSTAEHSTRITREEFVKSKKFSKIKVIKETNDFLIIEKPSGILVHPTDTNKFGTIVDWIMEKYPQLKQIGEDPTRPAIVHRLDKDVSGLMLIPKTQAAFDYFKQQFKNHTIIKKYLALVEGAVPRDEDEINFPIGRSRTKPGLFAARPLNQDGKKAISRFRVIKRFRNFTLLEVEILTGRTHQIRVHLLSYGTPVVGDKLYHPKLKPRNNPGRIFLHAAELIFTGPDGKVYHFKSKLPALLAKFEKKLK